MDKRMHEGKVGERDERRCRRSQKADETEQKMVDREIRRENSTDRHTRRFCLTPCSQWAVSDPHWLLYGYSPASNGISNSLINQELCYVTLPLPLTHKRENHHHFFLQHNGFILLCASPTELLILYIKLVLRLQLKFEKFILIMGPSLRKTY